MTDPQADRHRCFELDGAVVHGDPDMPPQVRDALAALIDAARRAHLRDHPDAGEAGS